MIMNEKVKQAIGKIRELDLYDLHSEDFDNILGALNNLEELIKGKDEYIAKLCNDRAELKEENKNLKIENERCSKYIENLEKRTVNDGFVIDILKEFARIVSRKFEHYFQEFKQGNIDQYVINETYFVKGKDREFDLIKKVVEKNGTK